MPKEGMTERQERSRKAVRINEQRSKSLVFNLTSRGELSRLSEER
jgi:hypothetical protein